MNTTRLFLMLCSVYCPRQVALADLILVNKVDLVSREELNRVSEAIRSAGCCVCMYVMYGVCATSIILCQRISTVTRYFVGWLVNKEIILYVILIL